MATEQEQITAAACAQEIGLLARRLALLHYAFAETIIARLGEEEGKALVQEAVWAYGRRCGAAVRAGVEALGLPLTEENFGRVRDLPRYGWETGAVTLPNGEVRAIATFCPIAAAFQELGARGIELGRLYCYVDQAKYEAYNPDIAFAHAKNVLDGEPYCEFAVSAHADRA